MGMRRQTITVDALGGLHTLRHPQNQGAVDPRELGNAAIHRVTLIEWDEHHQMWAIRWAQHSPLRVKQESASGAEVWVWVANHTWSEEFIDRFGITPDRSTPYRALFREYEDAVRVEVWVIQSLQRAGKILW